METENELNLVITEERIKQLPLEVFYMMGDQTPQLAIDYIAHFVTDGKGDYLPKADAIKKVLKGRTIGDVETLMEQIKEAMDEATFPKA